MAVLPVRSQRGATSLQPAGIRRVRSWIGRAVASLRQPKPIPAGSDLLRCGQEPASVAWFTAALYGCPSLRR